MQLKVGDRVEVESESTERPARRGAIEEVVREEPTRATASAGTTGTRASTPRPPARSGGPSGPNGIRSLSPRPRTGLPRGRDQASSAAESRLEATVSGRWSIS